MALPRRLSRATWETRATAFTWTVHEGLLLAARHERVGAVVREVPGGHVEDGETFEQAAAREPSRKWDHVEVQDALATAQTELDAWKRHYNTERPYQAIGMAFRAV